MDLRNHSGLYFGLFFCRFVVALAVVIGWPLMVSAKNRMAFKPINCPMKLMLSK
jgi:hypothetical protein